jgi:hypothetical protein
MATNETSPGLLSSWGRIDSIRLRPVTKEFAEGRLGFGWLKFGSVRNRVGRLPKMEQVDIHPDETSKDPLMSIDPFTYCAPGRIKVLIVPVGKIRASYFSQCLKNFQQHKAVPFRDIPDDRLSKAMFNPSAFPQGQLLFEYLTGWDSDFSYLEDFQHWRKLYGVSPLFIN